MNRFGSVELGLDKALQYFRSERPLLLDLRDKGSFDRGRIPSARHYPLDRLLNRFNELPKEKPIVLVCYHGNNSYKAAKFLKERGFDRVLSLRSGVEGWKAAGNDWED